MCRRLVIDLKWGNQDKTEELEDAGEMFDASNDFNSLTPLAEEALTDFLDSWFFGAYEFTITEIPR